MEGTIKKPLSKICHKYLTVMKLDTIIPYLKKTQKDINHVIEPLSSADISIFSSKVSYLRYIRKIRYKLDSNT